MKPSVASIVEATAAKFGIEPGHILARDAPGTRKKRLAHPRQVAMFVAREMTTTPRETSALGRQPVSLPALGRIFGRDHSTVLHAVRAVSRRAEHDSDLREKINEIRRMVDA